MGVSNCLKKTWECELPSGDEQLWQITVILFFRLSGSSGPSGLGTVGSTAPATDTIIDASSAKAVTNPLALRNKFLRAIITSFLYCDYLQHSIAYMGIGTRAHRIIAIIPNSIVTIKIMHAISILYSSLCSLNAAIRTMALTRAIMPIPFHNHESSCINCIGSLPFWNLVGEIWGRITTHVWGGKT